MQGHFLLRLIFQNQRGWYRIRQWPAEHDRKLHPKPKILITPKAYLSATLSPKISDFLHWVSEVCAQNYLKKT